MTFKELKISEPILAALDVKGYEEPTPIQEQAIPIGLEGRDIMGLAQTGTGKTAAFAIPIIQLLSQNQPYEGKKWLSKSLPGKKHYIKALILTPTRELAIQIDDCFTDYAVNTNLRHTVVFGGVKQGRQVDQLRRGVDILVATPGRLLDLMNQGFISLQDVTHFVLDEADRMLDMGFIHDIKKILPLLPKNRQTMLFSATMPDSIAELSRSILYKPERVEVAPVSSVVDTIAQGLFFVEKQEKCDLLIDVARRHSKDSILVFSRTKHGADKIARRLCKSGIMCDSIHGNKSQNARQRALSDFKEGRTHIIIATDIAARGIDIDNLQIVVNYDLPDVAETYVHRIGRTGRAGHDGTAISFCAPDEKSMLKDIQKLTGKKLPVFRDVAFTA